MTVTSADLSQWAAHRRAVVFLVSRRVPGIDPELAASRGLELLCVELIKQGHVPDPVAFWSAAAVDAALEMVHEEPPEEGSRAEVMTAPIRRALDFEVLSTAMERLPTGEQQILWDHHVGSRPVAAIADEIGVLPYAAKRRLRRAENRLADSLAETHTGTVDDAECKATRASMHDFVRHRLLPRRRQKVEDHMVQCAGCTRAFVDVRESYWMLRAAAPVLLLGAATAETSTGMAAGAAATGAGIGGWFAALGTRATMTVRSALTDPVSLAATVAGGLFVTTAVTTGVAVDADAAPSFLESGIVSVSTPDPVKAGARNATVSPKGDATHVPEPTTFTSDTSARATGTPSGPATGNDVPPGLTTKGGKPSGQAAKDSEPENTPGSAPSAPPGQAATDGTPPGPATDGVPPGQAKEKPTPPGQAKKDSTPPGQAKKESERPGQEKEKSVPPGHAKKGDTPPGQATKEKTPPGQAKKNRGDQPARQSPEPDRSGQERSRSTIAS